MHHFCKRNARRAREGEGFSQLRPVQRLVTRLHGKDPGGIGADPREGIQRLDSTDLGNTGAFTGGHPR